MRHRPGLVLGSEALPPGKKTSATRRLRVGEYAVEMASMADALKFEGQSHIIQ
jgi:hypothetical protein